MKVECRCWAGACENSQNPLTMTNRRNKIWDINLNRFMIALRGTWATWINAELSQLAMRLILLAMEIMCRNLYFPFRSGLGYFRVQAIANRQAGQWGFT